MKPGKFDGASGALQPVVMATKFPKTAYIANMLAAATVLADTYLLGRDRTGVVRLAQDRRVGVETELPVDRFFLLERGQEEVAAEIRVQNDLADSASHQNTIDGFRALSDEFHAREERFRWYADRKNADLASTHSSDSAIQGARLVSLQLSGDINVEPTVEGIMARAEGMWARDIARQAKTTRRIVDAIVLREGRLQGALNTFADPISYRSMQNTDETVIGSFLAHRFMFRAHELFVEAHGAVDQNITVEDEFAGTFISVANQIVSGRIAQDLSFGIEYDELIINYGARKQNVFLLAEAAHEPTDFDTIANRILDILD